MQTLNENDDDDDDGDGAGDNDDNGDGDDDNGQLTADAGTHFINDLLRMEC